MREFSQAQARLSFGVHTMPYSQLTDAQKRQGVRRVFVRKSCFERDRSITPQLLGIPTTVVMPDDAPFKQAATRGYGVQVLLYSRTEMTREDLAQKLWSDRNPTFIPPCKEPF